MVAQTVALPNIRKFFVPDPGMIFVDADLAGADAQVVAWEARDIELMAAFRAGLKVHLKNCREMYPAEVRGWSDEAIKNTDRPGGIYHDCKRQVHAYNYYGQPRTLAALLGRTVSSCENFRTRWFSAHPGIPQWHDRTRQQLAETRCVTNRFGYRVFFFGRVESLLPEALAWVPQSTIACCTNKGALRIDPHDRHHNPKPNHPYPWLQLLLQVHDSLDFQIPISQKHTLPNIAKSLETKIPYEDPLTIKWSIKTSRVSWGDCE